MSEMLMNTHATYRQL